MEAKDARMRATTECLKSMRILTYLQKLEALRDTSNHFSALATFRILQEASRLYFNSVSNKIAGSAEDDSCGLRKIELALGEIPRLWSRMVIPTYLMILSVPWTWKLVLKSSSLQGRILVSMLLFQILRQTGGWLIDGVFDPIRLIIGYRGFFAWSIAVNTGRILSRASTDQSALDLNVPCRLGGLAFSGVQLLYIVGVMSQAVWSLNRFCSCVCFLYLATGRELSRLQGVTTLRNLLQELRQYEDRHVCSSLSLLGCSHGVGLYEARTPHQRCLWFLFSSIRSAITPTHRSCFTTITVYFPESRGLESWAGLAVENPRSSMPYSEPAGGKSVIDGVDITKMISDPGSAPFHRSNAVRRHHSL
ncbi:hypothetical protein SELMODRAFT_408546 [Selaginella moellendorffii]|uniref:Uncharacterized protein n=1 Tax=Selaginella moellendorffii TaxID=88036 RepID=D8R8M8_SELML|nr:hypothetical protein SELMODRAFT_408546 [Selaginella moellendorffii]